MEMRENLYNDDDPGLITEKFWSHIKTKSYSCRFPETIIKLTSGLISAYYANTVT